MASGNCCGSRKGIDAGGSSIRINWSDRTIATKNDKIENFRARGKILVFSLDDGGYSNWGAWSRCSETCGKGSHTRTRTCTSPPPSAGGKDCSSLGPDKETEECDAGGCPGMITRTTKIILFLFSFFASIASTPSPTFSFSASRHFFLPVCPSSFSLILLFPSSRPSPFQPLQTLRSAILFRPLSTLQRFPFFFSIPSFHTTLSDYAL